MLLLHFFLTAGAVKKCRTAPKPDRPIHLPKVPCIFGQRPAPFAGHRPSSSPRCLRPRGLSPAKVQALRIPAVFRFATILPPRQQGSRPPAAVPAGTVPGVAPGDVDANKFTGIFAKGAMHRWAATGPVYRPRPSSLPRCLRLRGLSPGNGAGIADARSFSVRDDSTAPPATALARPPLCPQGLSPVLHREMRMPINSLGFSQKVPWDFRRRCHAPVGSDWPRFPATAPPHFSGVYDCGDCPPATVRVSRMLAVFRIATILPPRQRCSRPAAAVPAGTVPGVAPGDADANKFNGIFVKSAMHLWAATGPVFRPRPSSLPRCLRLRGLSPVTVRALRMLAVFRIATILPPRQQRLSPARRCARRDCPRCCTR